MLRTKRCKGDCLVSGKTWEWEGSGVHGLFSVADKWRGSTLFKAGSENLYLIMRAALCRCRSKKNRKWSGRIVLAMLTKPNCTLLHFGCVGTFWFPSKDTASGGCTLNFSPPSSIRLNCKGVQCPRSERPFLPTGARKGTCRARGWLSPSFHPPRPLIINREAPYGLRAHIFHYKGNPTYRKVCLAEAESGKGKSKEKFRLIAKPDRYWITTLTSFDCLVEIW